VILYLIDGMNWGHRAASMGDAEECLAKMVERLLRHAARRRQVVVALDREGPTFRHQLFAGFKAGRSADKIDRGAVEAVFGSYEEIRTQAAPVGFEADDVLATLATLGSGRGHRVMILSSDTDLLQVVRPTVTVGTRRRGEAIVYTPEGVFERFGVHPGQWVDYLALVGKPSNGIPGVKGIGAGRARTILRAGELDAVLRKPPIGLPAKLRRQLCKPETAEQVALWRDVCRLRTDLDLGGESPGSA
jgi:DNA polymerase-1